MSCTVIAGEQNVRNARLYALKGCLSLEMKGLKRRGQSAFAIVKQEFGLKGNKKEVYDQFLKIIENMEKEVGIVK